SPGERFDRERRVVPGRASGSLTSAAGRGACSDISSLGRCSSLGLRRRRTKYFLASGGVRRASEGAARPRRAWAACARSAFRSHLRLFSLHVPSQHWVGWMAELHRVLAEDGLLLATFLGPDWGPHLTGEERWLEDRVVMVVLGGGRPWDGGGQRTVVSEWGVRGDMGRWFG